MSKHLDTTKLSSAGLIIAMGIIYGDIGTSPLYVFNAISHNREISHALIVGSLSCIIWTLTLITTIKYVWLILRADNNGAGGTFALYALVKRRKKWLVIPAMIGGAALLADGIITPPISITSAIEGLHELEPLRNLTESTIMLIVLSILCLFFFIQQFGTSSIGKLFGPIMLIWFSLLGVLGAMNLGAELRVFEAINPWHAIQFVANYPEAIWLIGAVFLCTTGAEALYSDLGHCGRKNIRYSWIFVKSCLLLNYFGQGAHLLASYEGKVLTDAFRQSNGINAFYDLMPSWFVIPGVIIASLAAIIASQAMISGSFTLISEAIRLNLWPKMKINFPSDEKGQIYIPGMNWLIFVGCVFVVFYFRSSSNMEAAYGLAIITTMISTTILFSHYMVRKRVNALWIYLFLIGFLFIESIFLISNIKKFPEGGYITFIITALLFAVMYVWHKARKIKNSLVNFVRLDEYVHDLQVLQSNEDIEPYATHLIYLTSANNSNEIEEKIVNSILMKKPKRALIYWFIHVDTQDDPYTSEYLVKQIVPNEIIRVDFNLGFRVEQRIDVMFRRVVRDLLESKEINIHESTIGLEHTDGLGDFSFIVMPKFLSHDNDLPLRKRITMKLYFLLKKFSLHEEESFGLDMSNVQLEHIPLVVAPVKNLNMMRVMGSKDKKS